MVPVPLSQAEPPTGARRRCVDELTYVTDAKVVSHRRVAAGCRRLVLAAPEIARAVRPGQFLHVRCDGTADPLLRRPLSVHDADRERGTVTILYRVVGRGTALLAQKKQGGRVNVLGPLGRGFDPPAEHRRVAVVGGGIGIAPLFFLARELSADPLKRVPRRAVTVFQGARTAAELDVADFTTLPVNLFTATDDGSRGHAGSVVELFLDTVCHEPVEWVSAAGPPGMLRALAGALETLGLFGEFSLEERMGCGIGACVCCSCRIGAPDRWEYRRVCADGPVFGAREVVWE